MNDVRIVAVVVERRENTKYKNKQKMNKLKKTSASKYKVHLKILHKTPLASLIFSLIFKLNDNINTPKINIRKLNVIKPAKSCSNKHISKQKKIDLKINFYCIHLFFLQVQMWLKTISKTHLKVICKQATGKIKSFNYIVNLY